ncbi:MAG: hypothetical protein KatS3mg111_3065 [Pirellulaceae bacterium]|nr:MAG: hypothetical protein KatS3mg111_3065 [Pirellulaceae bacterium]
MIVLLGGSGYVGTAFRRFLKAQEIPFESWSRVEIDYYDPRALRQALERVGAEFLINCAGYTGKPNVDACEIHKTECLLGNAVLPGLIRQACEEVGLPWGHVSSGCIYSGSKDGGQGFTEADPPNFCFRTNNCSWYSGCKALGEECLADADNVYVWRLRIPFDHRDSPRNYLSKVMRYDRLLDAANSLSHLDDFVAACWHTWSRRAPAGIYNCTNTGYTTTRDVVQWIQEELGIEREFRFFANEAEFMQLGQHTPRSNCILDNAKLRSTGFDMPTVEQAVRRALRQWQWDNKLAAVS